MGAITFAFLIVGIFTINQVAAFHEVCAGCPINQDPASFPVDKLSKALATVNANEGVTRIISVKSQVVSGIKYTVVYESASGKTCTAIWFEEPWETESPMGTRLYCKAEKSSADLNGNKFVGALLKAHQMQKRSLTAADLSPSTVDLIKEHAASLIDDRTNSKYTQKITSMTITKVERYGHGYQVDADAVLTFTSCLKYEYNPHFDPNETCTLSNNQQSCSFTLTLVQPQGGRKWYKLNQFNCKPL